MTDNQGNKASENTRLSSCEGYGSDSRVSGNIRAKHPLAGMTFPCVVEVEGNEVIVIQSSRGFHAIQRWCPHQQLDLLGGKILKDGFAIRCPHHGYVFKLSNGEGVNCGGLRGKVYKVYEENGFLVFTEEV